MTNKSITMVINVHIFSLFSIVYFYVKRFTRKSFQEYMASIFELLQHLHIKEPYLNVLNKHFRVYKLVHYYTLINF